MHPRKTSLRAISLPTHATTPVVTTIKPRATAQQIQEDQMHALALELGYFCTPTAAYMVDLSTLARVLSLSTTLSLPIASSSGPVRATSTALRRTTIPSGKLP